MSSNILKGAEIEDGGRVTPLPRPRFNLPTLPGPGGGHRFAVPPEPPPAAAAEGASHGLSPQELARQTAERIIAEAQRESEAIAERAYREGFAQGEKAGLELGQQKAALIAKSLDAIVQELSHAHEIAVKQVEGDLIRVALAIATRILREELSLHPERIVNVAREAIKRTVTGGRITLRLNPLDIQYLQQSGSVLPEFASHSDQITLQADYGVARGGVIVETDSGQIDATLETQLSILWNTLAPQQGDLFAGDGTDAT